MKCFPRNQIAGWLFLLILMVCAMTATARTERGNWLYTGEIEFEGPVNHEGSLSIDDTEITATAAEINSACDPASVVRVTSVSVTNDEAITLSAAYDTYIITPYNQATGTTTTNTIALPYTVDKEWLIVIASAATNNMLLADNGTVMELDANLTLTVGDSVTLFSQATNVMHMVGQGKAARSAANIIPGSVASPFDGAAITGVTGTASVDGTVINKLDLHEGTNLNAAAMTGTCAAVNGAAITALTADNLTGLITIPLQSAVVTNEQILTFTASFVALTNVDAAVITNVLAAPATAGKLITVMNVGTNDIEIVVDTTRTNVLDVIKDDFTILSINATEWVQVGATNNVK